MISSSHKYFFNIAYERLMLMIRKKVYLEAIKTVYVQKVLRALKARKEYLIIIYRIDNLSSKQFRHFGSQITMLGTFFNALNLGAKNMHKYTHNMALLSFPDPHNKRYAYLCLLFYREKSSWRSGKRNGVDRKLKKVNEAIHQKVASFKALHGKIFKSINVKIWNLKSFSD